MKQDWGMASRTGGEGKYLQVFVGGNLKKKASLEHLDVDGRIIMKFSSNK